jgi:predicted Rossmann fold nucleotide-binding protein DprA/Smf involved in DNA uptake
MTNSLEIKARLQDGIKELEGDIAKLRAALTALDGDVNGSTAAKSRPSTRRSRRSVRKHEIVPAGKLSALLQATDGASTAELARETNGSTDQVLQMLKELEQAGQAHRTGQRRGTRWHAGAGSQAKS